MSVYISTPNMSYITFRRFKRSLRLMRVFILIKFAHLYNMRRLHQSLMDFKNDWNTAENISEMINEVFNENSSPKDFIYNENEQADECINITEGMKLCEKYLKQYGLYPHDVYAFCADVTYNNSAPLFKRYGQLVMYVIEDIVNYDLGMTTKDKTLKNIQHLKNFELAPKNLYMVTRKIVTQIENTFEDIYLKREERKESKSKNIT